MTTIRAEIDKALRDHDVSANVELSQDSQSNSATFAIAAYGKTHADTFSSTEIEDSGEAIDAPAAHKVRMLVSHFVR
ncbi:MAG: hypothetical protein ABI145_01515 [Steroidobacteraceae bacterium]